MKKLIVLFGIFSFIGSASFAYYYENETLHPEVLKAQGYSNSAILVTDKVHSFNEGLHSEYQRRYQVPKKRNIFGKGYFYIKNYVDPLQDDGKFAEHQINFTNTWNLDSTPKYATPEVSTARTKNKKSKYIENL